MPHTSFDKSRYILFFFLLTTNFYFLKKFHEFFLSFAKTFLFQLNKTCSWQRKKISLLRSPHVNKNAQEHFQQKKFLRLYQSSQRLTQEKLRFFHKQVLQLKKQFNAVGIQTRLKEKKIFESFF